MSARSYANQRDRDGHRRAYSAAHSSFRLGFSAGLLGVVRAIAVGVVWRRNEALFSDPHRSVPTLPSTARSRQPIHRTPG